MLEKCRIKTVLFKENVFINEMQEIVIVFSSIVLFVSFQYIITFY